jgi:hypothetical protein
MYTLTAVKDVVLSGESTVVWFHHADSSKVVN